MAHRMTREEREAILERHERMQQRYKAALKAYERSDKGDAARAEMDHVMHETIAEFIAINTRVLETFD